jgi:hypothetical protein
VRRAAGVRPLERSLLTRPAGRAVRVRRGELAASAEGASGVASMRPALLYRPHSHTAQPQLVGAGSGVSFLDTYLGALVGLCLCVPRWLDAVQGVDTLRAPLATMVGY